jgi:hypothetical protein
MNLLSSNLHESVKIGNLQVLHLFALRVFDSGWLACLNSKPLIRRNKGYSLTKPRDYTVQVVFSVVSGKVHYVLTHDCVGHVFKVKNLVDGFWLLDISKQLGWHWLSPNNILDFRFDLEIQVVEFKVEFIVEFVKGLILTSLVGKDYIMSVKMEGWVVVVVNAVDELFTYLLF